MHLIPLQILIEMSVIEMSDERRESGSYVDVNKVDGSIYIEGRFFFEFK